MTTAFRCQLPSLAVIVEFFKRYIEPCCQLKTERSMAKKIGNFALFTAVVLLLVGGLRAGWHGVAIVRSFQPVDEAAELAAFEKQCARFVGLEQSESRGGGGASETGEPSDTGLKTEKNPCQALSESYQRLSDESVLSGYLLWAAGIGISVATLLAGILVLCRLSVARSLMKGNFVAQILAFLGEIGLAANRYTLAADEFWKMQSEEEAEALSFFFMDVPVYMTVLHYLLLVLLYLVLFLMVRSRRMFPQPAK